MFNRNVPKYVLDGDKFFVEGAGGKKMLLRIVSDDSPESPRDWDNIGTMYCFHDRHCLGDPHDYSNSREFLMDIVRNSVKYETLIRYVKNDKLENLKLEYNRSAHKWALKARDYGCAEWYEVDKYAAPLNWQDWALADDIVEYMRLEDLLEVAKNENFILPLYLYDHSSVTMNTGGFSCSWDSGLVGWIHVSKEKVFDDCMWLPPEKRSTNDPKILNDKSNWESPSEENWKRIAEYYLENEVRVYDDYLTGSVYAYELCEIDEVGDVIQIVESCGGFYGNETEQNGILDNFKILGDVNAQPEDVEFLAA